MRASSLLAALCALGFSTTTDAAAPSDAIVPAPGYTIKNCVTPFDSAKVEKTAVGYQFWFANTALADGKTVKLSVVGPHLATHPPHRHPEDEFFFILEGRRSFCSMAKPKSWDRRRCFIVRPGICMASATWERPT